MLVLVVDYTQQDRIMRVAMGSGKPTRKKGFVELMPSLSTSTTYPTIMECSTSTQAVWSEEKLPTDIS
jgi:hypothetical protein